MTDTIEMFDRRLMQAMTRSQATITVESRKPYPSFSVVERKGQGHPDSLADALAYALSRCYSLYTLERFGVILHHNFDKVGLMGGKANVYFGGGQLNSPIRVLLNGRASDWFGGEKIPVRSLLESEVKSFFAERFPMIDPEKDLRFLYEVSSGSSPGQVHSSQAASTRKHWFEPRDESDLPYLRSLVANDTSTGVGYAPLSPAGNLAMSIDSLLSDPGFKAENPWVGTDIKIMINQTDDNVQVTACVPQLGQFVPNLGSYISNREFSREKIVERVNEKIPGVACEVSVNARDNDSRQELYLTYTGSSIETGDEGFVGRGNRANGLIDMTRPFSMEGFAGKNPVYHVGFVYTAASQRIAELLHAAFGLPTEVYLTSKTGHALNNPSVIVSFVGATPDNVEVRHIVYDVLNGLPNITSDFVRGKTIFR